MFHRSIKVIIAITCVCIFVQAQSEIFQVTKKSNTRYCGKILADMLSIICKGMYNTKFHKKSYESDSDEDYGYGQQQQYLEETRFPFRSRPNAAALIPGSFRRYARGVHDECCKKSCTISELLTYCAVQ